MALAGAPPAAHKAPRSQALRTADVARILGISDAAVRAMVRAGLCRPARRGRQLEFSFQDLVLLRAAKSLRGNHVSPQRLRRALRDLARQLPHDRPLSGVRLYADGGQVFVRDGRAAWEPSTGQAVFIFDVDELARRTRVVVPAEKRPPVEPAPPPPSATAAEWFEHALGLEEDDPNAARRAYERALELDPDNADACINLGRLTHAAGDAAGAVRLYRNAILRTPNDAVAHYNLALTLEDQGDTAGALAHYRHAVDLEADFADAHFNLASLLERLGKSQQALRHLAAYKKLTNAKKKY